ncbi:MAG TPA: protoporphyrinogen oxidase, partial [Bacillota bacterium]
MSARRVAVIGGGITGLAAALRLVDLAAERSVPLQVTLLEADASFGGKIRTDRSDGFIIEQGPDSLLARKAWGVDLCRRLGLEGQLTGTGPRAGRAYLAAGDRLEPMPPGMVLGVPASIGSLLTSRLVPPLGRLRAALEPWIPPRRKGPRRDESLHDFLVRRLGRPAAEAVAEPLLEAVHAGDARRLSARATYPQLVLLEERYGSLVRGMRNRRLPGEQAPGDAGPRRPAGPAGRDGSPAGPAGRDGSRAEPGPTFVTVRTGLATLVERALEHLGRSPAVRLLAGRPVTALNPLPEDAWEVFTADRQRERFEGVVLAVPAFAGAEMVAPWAPAAAEALQGIPYASTAAVALAYPRDAVAHPLDGSGFLVPRSRARVITGCTWLSTKWPHTAPAGTALLRCFVGRAGSEETLSLSDTQLIEAVDVDLRRFLDIGAPPSLARVYRWPRAMPQYEVGHLQR